MMDEFDTESAAHSLNLQPERLEDVGLKVEVVEYWLWHAGC